MAEEEKVALDVAEAEFERFIEKMELDIDPSSMSVEDKASFEKHKRPVIQAIVRGRLVVDEKGQPVYTPVASEGSPIVFREVKGSDFMAMDGHKRDHDFAKLYAAMAAQTGQAPKRFANMGKRDLAVCQALSLLFMA